MDNQPSTSTIEIVDFSDEEEIENETEEETEEEIEAEIEEEMEAKTEEPSTKRQRVSNSIDSEDGFTGDTTWSMAEKKKLYNALIDYGSNNLDEIVKRIPTKNKTTVLSYMLYLEKSGRASLKEKENNRKIRKVREAPIDQWIEYACRMSATDNYKLMDVSRALKYISLFEPRSDKSYVALNDCYEVLATCLAGDAPKYLNPECTTFLTETVHELVTTVKFGKLPEERKFLNTLPRRRYTACYRSKKKIYPEIKKKKSIVTNEVLNPLKVPKDLLAKEK